MDEIATLAVAAHPVAMRRAVGLHDVVAANLLGRALRVHGPFAILHAHSSKAGAIARLAAAGSAKRVYTPHAFRGLDPDAGLLARIVYDGAEIVLGALRTDALIAVSQGELDFAARRHIADGRRHLILNGLLDTPSANRPAARARLGFADEQVVFGFVGRLSHQKAPERFVAAMARAMRADGRIVAAMLDDGEYPDIVADVIHATGMAERFVRLRGERAADYLPGFDALLMTSRFEGLSYVLLESLAAGVPVVTTAVAGAREVIAGSACGIVVPNGDEAVPALAQAVLTLAGDPALRARMIDAVRTRSAELNGERMIEETERLYRSLLKGRADGC